MIQRAIRRQSTREFTPKAQRNGNGFEEIGIDPNTIKGFRDLHSGEQKELLTKLPYVQAGEFYIRSRRVSRAIGRITVIVEYDPLDSKKTVKLSTSN